MKQYGPKDSEVVDLDQESQVVPTAATTVHIQVSVLFLLLVTPLIVGVGKLNQLNRF